MSDFQETLDKIIGERVDAETSSLADVQRACRALGSELGVRGMGVASDMRGAALSTYGALVHALYQRERANKIIQSTATAHVLTYSAEILAKALLGRADDPLAAQALARQVLGLDDAPTVEIEHDVGEEPDFDEDPCAEKSRLRLVSACKVLRKRLKSVSPSADLIFKEDVVSAFEALCDFVGADEPCPPETSNADAVATLKELMVRHPETWRRMPLGEFKRVCEGEGLGEQVPPTDVEEALALGRVRVAEGWTWRTGDFALIDEEGAETHGRQVLVLRQSSTNLCLMVWASWMGGDGDTWYEGGDLVPDLREASMRLRGADGS